MSIKHITSVAINTQTIIPVSHEATATRLGSVQPRLALAVDPLVVVTLQIAMHFEVGLKHMGNPLGMLLTFLWRRIQRVDDCRSTKNNHSISWWLRLWRSTQSVLRRNLPGYYYYYHHHHHHISLIVVLKRSGVIGHKSQLLAQAVETAKDILIIIIRNFEKSFISLFIYVSC